MTESIIPPDFDDVLVELKNEIFAQLNCVQIGKISAVNDNQTVEITLQVKRRVQGDTITSYPVLVDCPYFVLSGGNAYIDLPIQVGDYCLVLFNDRNLDTWWSSENVAEPLTRRKHSLSDGIALIGISPESGAKEMDGTVTRILGPSGPGAELEAARKTDEVKSTATEDATFWSWITRVNTFNASWISALETLENSGGTEAGVVAYAVAMQSLLATLATAPVTLTGKITGGSTEVKIG